MPEPVTNPTISPTTGVWDSRPPMPPTDLIFDDGEPLETNRHRIAMNVLIRSRHQALADRRAIRQPFILKVLAIYYQYRFSRY